VLGRLFTRTGLARFIGVLGAPAMALVLVVLAVDPSVLFSAHADAEGAFYRVVPHDVMIAVFGTLGLLVAVALLVGLVRFWRDAGGTSGRAPDPSAVRRAASDALTLRYLDGGGPGCAYPEDVASPARRRYHHLTFYGFMLCFAATTVAAVYHNVMGWPAPYALWSVPVVLGCLGGVGLLVGPAGLLRLKMRRDPERRDRTQTGMDVTFLVALFLTSLTGFLLLALRESSAMGVTLAVHLGLVAGVFLTMPYGKFVHGFYRFAALVRNAVEVELEAEAAGEAKRRSGVNPGV
jgi:citrate/tricarballylate utilization protein